eukprot:PhF_6_TR33573/c0_g1_i1/m.48988
MSNSESPEGSSGSSGATIKPKHSTMTNETFSENVTILKKLGLRGVRSFAIVAVGLVSFHYAREYRKERLAETQKALPSTDEDPTQRYLKEMSSMGWPVEEGEEAVRKMEGKGNKI